MTLLTSNHIFCRLNKQAYLQKIFKDKIKVQRTFHYNSIMLEKQKIMLKNGTIQKFKKNKIYKNKKIIYD